MVWLDLMDLSFFHDSIKFFDSSFQISSTKGLFFGKKLKYFQLFFKVF